jgi:hypothetical protein
MAESLRGSSCLDSVRPSSSPDPPLGDVHENLIKRMPEASPNRERSRSVRRGRDGPTSYSVAFALQAPQPKDVG